MSGWRRVTGVLFLGAVACSTPLTEADPEPPEERWTVVVDTATTGDSDGGQDTETQTRDTQSDTAPPDPDPDPYAELSPALRWVRTNPMLISGLVVSMSAPPADVVSTYLGSFGANTAHFWADGLPDSPSSWREHAGSEFQWISWVDEGGISYKNGQLIAEAELILQKI